MCTSVHHYRDAVISSVRIRDFLLFFIAGTETAVDASDDHSDTHNNSKHYEYNLHRRQTQRVRIECRPRVLRLSACLSRGEVVAFFASSEDTHCGVELARGCVTGIAIDRVRWVL